MRSAMPIIAAALVLACAAACPAARVGLGIMAGEPTGLALKAWSSGRFAIDAAAGWSLGEEGRLYLHADCLWHSYDFDFSDLPGTLPWYVGVGGRLALKEGRDSKLGVRVPFGLDFLFGRQPFDVFLEVAPIVDLVPDTDFDLSGGVGVRYYF